MAGVVGSAVPVLSTYALDRVAGVVAAPAVPAAARGSAAATITAPDASARTASRGIRWIPLMVCMTPFVRTGSHRPCWDCYKNCLNQHEVTRRELTQQSPREDQYREGLIAGANTRIPSETPFEDARTCRRVHICPGEGPIPVLVDRRSSILSPNVTES